MKRAADLGIALLMAACLLALASCAAIRPEAPVAKESEQAWNAFREREARLAESPDSISLRASLYYSRRGRTNRTVVRLWGDVNHPLRLDLAAGIGTLISLYREDDAEWMGYYPDEKTVYLHPDSRSAMPALGVPIPFSLRDLAMLVTGRLSTLAPGQYVLARQSGNGSVFTLGPDSRIDTLALDGEGRPMSLSRGGENGFSVAFENYDGGGPDALSRKLVLTAASGETATFRIKELELSREPWQPEALELPLPPGTETVRLAPGPRDG